MKTPQQVAAAVKVLCHFIAAPQLSVLRKNCYGEEGEWFKEKLCSLADTIEKMPRPYKTDGKGDTAVAHLRYFGRGDMEWHITERDSSPEQYQAFGLANIGYGAELGYIPIQELIENNVEIDLHFEPCTLKEIKAKKG